MIDEHKNTNLYYCNKLNINIYGDMRGRVPPKI